MELLVSVKLMHSYLHGITWNCSCQRILHNPDSMEFHGTARVSEIGALLVPSMELLVSAKLAHHKFHGIPWNSIELLVSAKLAHLKFHGIPRNFSCQRNWRISSSMELNGTAHVSKIGAFLDPWNSMELLVSLKLACSKFHGIPWNFMKLLMSSKLAHFKFLGIPWNIAWNCSCHRNWRSSSSVEFYGIPWNCLCQRN